MSYTWTNGEVITAEKLNQTGGGTFSISRIPAVLAVTENVSIAGESQEFLSSANSRLETYAGDEALDFKEGIFVPFGNIGTEPGGGPYLIPSGSVGFYDEDFAFQVANSQTYEQTLYEGDRVLVGTFYTFS